MDDELVERGKIRLELLLGGISTFSILYLLPLLSTVANGGLLGRACLLRRAGLLSRAAPLRARGAVLLGAVAIGRCDSRDLNGSAIFDFGAFFRLLADFTRLADGAVRALLQIFNHILQLPLTVQVLFSFLLQGSL